MMISSTVAVEELNAFIVTLSSNCWFGDQSAISIDEKGGVQCFSYRADPVLS
jgi:hypothetical protein